MGMGEHWNPEALRKPGIFVFPNGWGVINERGKNPGWKQRFFPP
jgi:hypothetical protein